MAFAVNKTGNNMLVYDPASSLQIGTLNVGETAYTISHNTIRFLTSNGQLQIGRIDDCDDLTNWLAAPYYNIDGKAWFRARYDMDVYDANGNYWGQVKAGEFVWTDNAVCKESNKDWLLIKGVRNQLTKEWEIPTGGFGYVNTGFCTHGSGRNYIGIYGNW